MPERKNCDVEGCENRAVVYLEKVVNGHRSNHYYCEGCAAEKGLGPKSEAFDIGEILAQMGAEAPGADKAETCGFCGLGHGDFKKTGRLGCPECYGSFEAKLRTLLRRIHGSDQHAGKVYLPPGPGADEAGRLRALRGRLARAVAAEDFEHAAVLRDAIRLIEAPDDGDASAVGTAASSSARGRQGRPSPVSAGGKKADGDGL